MLRFKRRHLLCGLRFGLGVRGVGLRLPSVSAVLLGAGLLLGNVGLRLGLLNLRFLLLGLLLTGEVLLHLLFGRNQPRHVQLAGHAFQQLAAPVVTDDAHIHIVGGKLQELLAQGVRLLTNQHRARAARHHGYVALDRVVVAVLHVVQPQGFNHATQHAAVNVANRVLDAFVG